MLCVLHYIKYTSILKHKFCVMISVWRPACQYMLISSFVNKELDVWDRLLRLNKTPQEVLQTRVRVRSADLWSGTWRSVSQLFPLNINTRFLLLNAGCHFWSPPLLFFFCLTGVQCVLQSYRYQHPLLSAVASPLCDLQVAARRLTSANNTAGSLPAAAEPPAARRASGRPREL